MILTHPCGIVFDIVSSDVYDFFPKIKIFRTFPQKWRYFLKISKKNQENGNFFIFSYNYVHLAHAILYVAVADDKIYC